MHVTETAEKIKRMEIRGAGRIARAAVEALVSHAGTLTSRDLPSFRKGMEEAAATLIATRPTAVSMPNAVHLVMASMEDAGTVAEARAAVKARGEAFLRSSAEAVQRIGAGSKRKPA